jgi:hypothetical protein
MGPGPWSWSRRRKARPTAAAMKDETQSTAAAKKEDKARSTAVVKKEEEARSTAAAKKPLLLDAPLLYTAEGKEVSTVGAPPSPVDAEEARRRGPGADLGARLEDGLRAATARRGPPRAPGHDAGEAIRGAGVYPGVDAPMVDAGGLLFVDSGRADVAVLP